MTASPLVSRSVQRSAYGDRLLAACDEIVRAVRSGGDPRPAVDRALILQPPPGEDPVVWLALALAAQVDVSVPMGRRLAWCDGGPALGCAS